MRVYHKYLHEYATVISRTATHYAVLYDEGYGIWTAPINWFEVV